MKQDSSRHINVEALDLAAREIQRLADEIRDIALDAHDRVREASKELHDVRLLGEDAQTQLQRARLRLEQVREQVISAEQALAEAEERLIRSDRRITEAEEKVIQAEGEETTANVRAEDAQDSADSVRGQALGAEISRTTQERSSAEQPYTPQEEKQTG